MRTNALLCGLAASLSFLSVPASARAAPADATFLTKDVQGGRYELALAQLGSRLATKPAIRRFAQMVVRDHAAANAALMRLVKAEGVRAPAGMTAEDAAMLTRMKTLRGTNFDRAFVDEMNRINIEDAQAAGKETAATSDRSITAYLARFAAMDARHKQAAAALRKGV